MMGCGKTTIGKLLSEKLKFDFIDCDEYLENKYNKTIKECFDISENYFRELETSCCVELSNFSNKIISTGGGIVKNKRNIELFKDDIIIFVNRPIEDILSDINCECRPLILNTDKKRIKDIYDNRIILYKTHCTYEINNNKNINLVVDDIINQIKKH